MPEDRPESTGWAPWKSTLGRRQYAMLLGLSIGYRNMLYLLHWPTKKLLQQGRCGKPAGKAESRNPENGRRGTPKLDSPDRAPPRQAEPASRCKRGSWLALRDELETTMVKKQAGPKRAWRDRRSAPKATAEPRRFESTATSRRGQLPKKSATVEKARKRGR